MRYLSQFAVLIITIVLGIVALILYSYHLNSSNSNFPVTKEPTSVSSDYSQKLAPNVRMQLNQVPARENPQVEITDTPTPTVEVLMQYTGDATNLSRYGFELQTQIGWVVVGTVPLARLPELEALTDVLRVEAATPIQPTLDISLPESRVTPLHTGSPTIKGAGAIVGVIDTGIDYTHPAFRKPDGTSRILAIWDQNLQPVSGEANPKGPLYNYGVEYNPLAMWRVTGSM